MSMSSTRLPRGICVVCFAAEGEDDAGAAPAAPLRLLPCLHVTCALCVRDLGERGPDVALACLECGERFDTASLVDYVSPRDVTLLQGRGAPDPWLALDAGGAAVADDAKDATPTACAAHARPWTAFCLDCDKLQCAACVDGDRPDHVWKRVLLADLPGRAAELRRVRARVEPRLAEISAAIAQLRTVVQPLNARYVPLAHEIDECFDRCLRHVRNRGRLTLSPALASRFGVVGSIARRFSVSATSRASVSAAAAAAAAAAASGESTDEEDEQPTAPPTPSAPKALSMRRSAARLVSRLFGVDLSRASGTSSSGDISAPRESLPDRVSVPTADLNGDRVTQPPRLTREQRHQRQEERAREIEAWRDDLKRTARRTLDGDIKTITLQVEGLDLVQQQYTQAIELCQVVQDLLALPQKEVAVRCALRLEAVVVARLEHFGALKPCLEPLVDDTLRFTRFLEAGADPMVSSLDFIGRLERPRDLSAFKKVALPSAIIEGTANTRGPRDTRDTLMFNRPYALACNPWGQLVVADYGADAVVVVTPGGDPRLRIRVDSPLSVAVGDLGHIWVANTNNEVRCYTAAGALVRCLRVNGVCRITIAPTNGDLILATLDYVAAITSAGDVRWKTDAADGATYGFVCTPTGELLTGSWRKQSRCLLSLADGHLLRHVGTSLFPAPTEVAATSRFFVASDPASHSVALFTHAGRRVHAWGAFGSQPGEFNGPGSVAVLHDDRVAVADVNNARIQLF